MIIDLQRIFFVIAFIKLKEKAHTIWNNSISQNIQQLNSFNHLNSLLHFQLCNSKLLLHLEDQHWSFGIIIQIKIKLLEKEIIGNYILK